MSEVLQLLRVPPEAWDLIKQSLALCGEEGQLRMKGRHLIMDGLAIEADPSISQRFPSEFDVARVGRHAFTQKPPLRGNKIDIGEVDRPPPPYTTGDDL